MTSELIQYAIICPLVFIAGYCDAIAGGGGLISLPAYMISGIPVHMAIATNKMSASMGTALATWRYYKDGFIPWALSLKCAVFALVGSFLGAHAAVLMDSRHFTILMLFVVPLTAVYVLKDRSLDHYVAPEKLKHPTLTLLICLGVSFGIGVYDGFYGPGTGTFLLILLQGLAHLKLSQANGTCKAINLVTNISALTVFIYKGKVLLTLGIVAGLFSILGNYLGAKEFAAKGAKSTKPIIIVVLTIFFIKILWELLMQN